MRRITTHQAALRRAQGIRIAAAADYAELTQADLAQKITLTQPVLSRLISGARDPKGQLAAIARACGVRIEWLRSGTGKGPGAMLRRSLTPEEVLALLKGGRTITVEVDGDAGIKLAAFAAEATGAKVRARAGDRVLVTILR